MSTYAFTNKGNFFSVAKDGAITRHFKVPKVGPQAIRNGEIIYLEADDEHYYIEIATNTIIINGTAATGTADAICDNLASNVFNINQSLTA